jgi:hypothetical protein
MPGVHSASLRRAGQGLGRPKVPEHEVIANVKHIAHVQVAVHDDVGMLVKRLRRVHRCMGVCYSLVRVSRVSSTII